MLGGDLDSTLKLGQPSRLYLQGSGNYTHFNGNTLIDKEKGSAMYVYRLDPHWNLFAISTHLHDRFLQIEYRTTLRGGISYRDFLQDLFALSLFGVSLAPEHDIYYGDVVNDDLRMATRINLGVTSQRILRWRQTSFTPPSSGTFRAFALIGG